MTKPRKKKHNAIAAARLRNIESLKPFTVAFFANDALENEYIKLINTAGDEVTITPKIADAITNFSYKWFINLAIGCYKSNGDREIKFDFVPCEIPYKQASLCDDLNDRHMEFIDDVKAKNARIQFVGWLARPSGRELSVAEMYNIFDKLGAWK